MQPGWKGMRMHTDYCQKYMIFRPIFVCITARYCPEPFILVRSKKKVKNGALRFCACSNLWILSFNVNVPEYRPLQACFNIEMPSSIIFEPLAPTCLDVTWHWTINISLITNAHANRVFARSFSPRNEQLICIKQLVYFLVAVSREVTWFWPHVNANSVPVYVGCGQLRIDILVHLGFKCIVIEQ